MSSHGSARSSRPSDIIWVTSDPRPVLPLLFSVRNDFDGFRDNSGNRTPGVHEAWLKIAGDGGAPFANRRHFFEAAATAMQQILVDDARRKQRVKHGGHLAGVEFHESRIAVFVPPYELLAVSDALAALGREDPQAAEVVRLRYFVAGHRAHPVGHREIRRWPDDREFRRQREPNVHGGMDLNRLRRPLAEADRHRGASRRPAGDGGRHGLG